MEIYWHNASDFVSRLVTMEKTWLYHNDPETKQKLMEWRQSATNPSQNFSSAKIRWKSFRLDFLGSTMHPPLFIYCKGLNYQLWVLHITACANDDYFERKTPREVLQEIVSYTTMPRITKNCKTRNRLTWASNIMIAHPMNRNRPPRTATSSLNWKKLKIVILGPTRNSLLPRLAGSKDKILNFLSGFEKLEQRARKCIELRVEYVE